jgi:hypothetical protein
MNFYEVLSDQLFTWSDEDDHKIPFRVAPAPSSAPAPIAALGHHPPRFPDRALQTVWQARLQVRSKPWARSQILPVDKLSRYASPDGLRAAGVSRTSQEAAPQLPASSRDLGRDLQDQSRAATPQGALRRQDGRCWLRAHRDPRYEIRKCPAGQHAGGVARRSTELLGSHGGRR